jgi:hypothetical protein
MAAMVTRAVLAWAYSICAALPKEARASTVLVTIAATLAWIFVTKFDN